MCRKGKRKGEDTVFSFCRSLDHEIRYRPDLLFILAYPEKNICSLLLGFKRGRSGTEQN
jgi:hypothetical protein